MTTPLFGTAQENIQQRLDRLRGQIRSVESVWRASETATISSGVAAIDRLLPGGGYARGSLIEWLAPAAGCGAEWLALQLACRAALDGGAIVIVDPRREFYPPAAVGLGLRMEQLVIIQGQRGDDLYWAIDQALRCTAVAAVWAVAALGGTSSTVDPCRSTTNSFLGNSFLGNSFLGNSFLGDSFLGNIDERWLRRFQLSAEQSGALGIFVRPISVARQPTWCDIQWRVVAPRSSNEMGIDASNTSSTREQCCGRVDSCCGRVSRPAHLSDIPHAMDIHTSNTSSTRERANGSSHSLASRACIMPCREQGSNAVGWSGDQPTTALQPTTASGDQPTTAINPSLARRASVGLAHVEYSQNEISPTTKSPDPFSDHRPISLQLLKCRGSASAGQTVDLELDTRTGELQLASARSGLREEGGSLFCGNNFSTQESPYCEKEPRPLLKPLALKKASKLSKAPRLRKTGS